MAASAHNLLIYVRTRMTRQQSPMAEFSILIVEDQEGPREALRAMLEPPYHVYTAGSCHDALTAFRANSIDLVIQDVHLPDGSGIDLLRPFKHLNPAVSLVLMSGDGTLGYAAEAMEYGALAFLKKPFEIQERRTLAQDAWDQKTARSSQPIR